MYAHPLDDFLVDSNLLDQDLPLEYNAWLLFRQIVDLILVKWVMITLQLTRANVYYSDFFSYCLFAFSCFRVPTGLSVGVHIMRFVTQIRLVRFN
jgi:phosphatidylethanolamine N-methyltransferase